ncbi:hypothetical protein SAMN05414139_08270 [Burkholderia sp. D7]|nr:hypothetical protein SAMN05414139_08270 [Burkholderia sp. D7]
MDQAVQQAFAVETQTLAKKSWTAYIKIFVMMLVGISIASAIFRHAAGAGILLFVLIALFCVYCFMEIRSVTLYYNDSGVWLYSGILPWNKGTQGVKWRDIENAVFYPSMGSWLFKSYKLRIAHRFTRSSEIVLTNMRRGNEAVQTINNMHQNLIRDGAVK